MNELQAAIMTRFREGGPLYDLTNGVLRFGLAEPKDVLPYTVFNIISDIPDWTMDSRDYENVRIQFDCYSDLNSSNQVGLMYKYLTALFDWCTLPITNHVSIYMKRLSSTLIPRDAVYNVWRYRTDYEVFLEKT